jgi:probable phosphoglycerate mutase
VCHGGVINAYLAHILGIDGPAGPMFFEPAYAGISRVMAARTGQRQLRSINEHGHVRALLP